MRSAIVAMTDLTPLLLFTVRQAEHERNMLSSVTAYQLSLKARVADLQSTSAELQTSADGFSQRATDAIQRFALQIDQHGKERNSVIQKHSATIQKMVKSLDLVAERGRATREELQADLLQMGKALTATSTSELDSIKQTASDLVSQLSEQLKASRKEIDSASRSQTSMANDIVTFVGEHLGNLKEELDGFRARVDSNAEEQLSATEAAHADTLRDAAKFQDGIQAAMAQLQSLNDLATSFKAASSSALKKQTGLVTSSRLERHGDLQKIQSGCEGLWNELGVRQVAVRKGYEGIHQTLKAHEKAAKAQAEKVASTVVESLAHHSGSLLQHVDAVAQRAHAGECIQAVVSLEVAS